MKEICTKYEGKYEATIARSNKLYALRSVKENSNVFITWNYNQPLSWRRFK